VGASSCCLESFPYSVELHATIVAQLWDMQTGESLWTSLAEASLESEAVGQDPVYFEDTARVTMGSIIADFMKGNTKLILRPTG